MAEMPFVSSLVQEDLPVWQQCLDTEFLRRMEDGTLDEACFKGYIVEDSLYLREWRRCAITTPCWALCRRARM